MKKIFYLAAVLIFSSQLYAQRAISTINNSSESYVIIVDGNFSVDTVEIYASGNETMIVDFLFLHEKHICYVVDFGGSFFYKKRYLGDDGFWKPESTYSIGNNSPRSNRHNNVKYRLLAEDSIEQIINDEKTIVDLVHLDELGFSSHHKRN